MSELSFNQRAQQVGKTVDQFVTTLHNSAEHCSYGNLCKKMIRYRLVVGLHDASVSLKLQMDPDLTLKKAVIAASQSEIVKKQQSTVRPSNHPPNIDQVKQSQAHMCTRCGKTPPHSRQDCPAQDVTCYS